MHHLEGYNVKEYTPLDDVSRHHRGIIKDFVPYDIKDFVPYDEAS